MAEMLPCTLSPSRYNPTFRVTEEDNNDDDDENEDSDNNGDYLDPSKESDYELIPKLRHGFMKANSLSSDEDNYSELQDLDLYWNTGINQTAQTTPLTLRTKSASQNIISLNNDNSCLNRPGTCCQLQSVTNGRQCYR